MPAKDTNDDLNISLQHFWGSSYWTTVLQQRPELSRQTTDVLLQKNRELDWLRARVMRLEENERRLARLEPAPDAGSGVG
jgi:hypothetical protein